jgi:hypothetical protein
LGDCNLLWRPVNGSVAFRLRTPKQPEEEQKDHKNAHRLISAVGPIMMPPAQMPQIPRSLRLKSADFQGLNLRAVSYCIRGLL